MTATEGVVVVGAGPVGCVAALLLADRGVPVALLERQPAPHPLPRAVHLDDEVLRVLASVGVAEAFLHRSRPASGLRLLDARHEVMAHFGRDVSCSDNGFPYANMFHQPDLEALLLERAEQHPMVRLRRGVAVEGLERTGRGLRVLATSTEDGRRFTEAARFVLGCDGANSTVRDLTGIRMDDLGFSERWLVVDVRTERELDGWGGVEQICDPRRAATFMRVVGDRYRWEFQLQEGEDDTKLLAPEVLGRLLSPWTGRGDLHGLELVRSATYTFRARVAQRFHEGDVFLLGDAAHLTPPFIGQGLGAGVRDAGNLAWKVADVVTGRATPALLDSYDAERRPHARALVKRAVLVGWAMTGGQDRAARLRTGLLAAVVRSERLRSAIANPVSPALKHGALGTAHGLHGAARRALCPGRLAPNPEVVLPDGRTCRLDEAVGARTALLVARGPEPELLARCERQGVLVVRLRASETPRAVSGHLDVALRSPAGRLQPLFDDPATTVLVRPDRVVAAVGKAALHLPWAVAPSYPVSQLADAR